MTAASFWESVKLGHEAKVREIAAITSLTELKQLKDDYGWTPVFWACALGNLDMVKCLLELDFSIDEKDVYGRTALDVAVAAQHTKILNFFATVHKKPIYTNQYKAHLKEGKITLSSSDGQQLSLDQLILED